MNIRSWNTIARVCNIDTLVTNFVVVQLPREKDSRKGQCCPEDVCCHQQHVSDNSLATVVTRGADACDRKQRVYEQHQRHGHVATKGVHPSVMSISRAHSWPLLDTVDRSTVSNDAFLKEKNQQAKTNDEKDKTPIQPEGSPHMQARRFLCRHYYPEGGWGWVVTVVGTLVHLLGSGLQLSVPATVALPAKAKFYHHPLHTAGESRHFWHFIPWIIYYFQLVFSCFALNYK